MVLGRTGERRLGWDMTLVILLLGVLLLVAIVASVGEEDDQPYDLDSNAPNGLLALRLWLQELGYDVQTTSQQAFVIPPDSDLILFFPGAITMTTQETELLLDWVARGGTLVIVNLREEEGPLARALFVRSRRYSTDFSAGLPTEPLSQVQPLMPDAPAELVDGYFGRRIDLADAEAAAPIYVPASLPTDAELADVAVQSWGEGFVWYLSGGLDLANAALQQGEPAMLVPPLLRGVPAQGTIVVDTYHLYGPLPGETGATLTSMKDWLYRTPAGWATIIFCLIVAAYWLLQGIRLGPSLPPTQSSRRRPVSDYVKAMAGLRRRAHQQRAVAAHHHQRFKIRLGRIYHVNPDLSDDAFVQQLSQIEGGPSTTELTEMVTLLRGLQAPPDENRLCELVANVDAMVDRMT